MGTLRERARRLQQDLFALKPIEHGEFAIDGADAMLDSNAYGKENIHPIAEATIESCDRDGRSAEKGERPLSPFTKFLTEMNSRINQQVFGATPKTLDLDSIES